MRTECLGQDQHRLFLIRPILRPVLEKKLFWASLSPMQHAGRPGQQRAVPFIFTQHRVCGLMGGEPTLTSSQRRSQREILTGTRSRGRSEQPDFHLLGETVAPSRTEHAAGSGACGGPPESVSVTFSADCRSAHGCEARTAGVELMNIIWDEPSHPWREEQPMMRARFSYDELSSRQRGNPISVVKLPLSFLFGCAATVMINSRSSANWHQLMILPTRVCNVLITDVQP